MRCRTEFDKRVIFKAVRRGNIKSLRQAGAYIRKSARNKIRKSSNASTPGTPPHTRRGLIKRSLLFGVEKARRRVLIGPAHTFVGLSMTAHEFGGKYKRQRYPKRPLMSPTLENVRPKLPELWKNAIK